MTHSLPNDGLLKAARIVTLVFQGILGVAFVALLIAIPIVLMSQAHIVDEMLPTATVAAGTVAATIAIVLFLGASAAAIGFVFLRILRRIIGSVGEGNPFILENADRLRTMGWLAVSIELLKLPASALSIFIAQQVKQDTFTVDVELSITGLLIALVLFILARVFRHGAAMREDLEGTV